MRVVSPLLVQGQHHAKLQGSRPASIFQTVGDPIDVVTGANID